jgi:hypothetical protein
VIGRRLICGSKPNVVLKAASNASKADGEEPNPSRAALAVAMFSGWMKKQSPPSYSRT